MICAFPEVHDDVEATTNEIKKAANNARNKLKSETSSTVSELRIIPLIFDIKQNLKRQITLKKVAPLSVLTDKICCIFYPL